MLALFFENYALQQYDNDRPLIEHAFFYASKHVAWGVAVSWLIFACVNGYGGPINWLLSFPVWQPLARISYSMYILHIPLQIIIAGTLRTPQLITDFNEVGK